MYAQAGTEDPQGLGYRLGLEYMTSIRDQRKSADDVERELAEFRKACGADSATYRRFIPSSIWPSAISSSNPAGETIMQLSISS